jgi:ATP-dependent Zn protease
MKKKDRLCKILLTLTISIILISIVIAEQDSLGTFTQNQDVNLLQICGTCTYNNISSIVLPNSTRLILDALMTKRGGEYNYTFFQTDLIGAYSVNGIGDLDGTDTAWSYDFEITTTGGILTTANVLFYLGSLFFLFILFIVSIIGMVKSENYIGKFALYWCSHVLAIVTTFSAWQIFNTYSVGFIGLTGIFKVLFYVIITAMFPMILLSLAWIFWMHTMTDEIKSMMDRGMTSEEAWDRAKSKKKGWFGI